MLSVFKASKFKVVLFAFLTLVMSVGSFVFPQAPVASASGTVLYFSSSTGSDSNLGTIDQPKETIDAAISLLAPGVTILFKRGDVWEGSLDLRNISGSSALPITIGAYGAGADPIITALTRLDDNWVNDGGNRWKHAINFSTALRLFVNGVSKYKVNTTNTSANEADVDQSYEWYIKSGWVYVGSTTGAPKNVELIRVSKSTVNMKNTNYVTIQNLDIKGGIVDIDAPSSHITIDNNKIRQMVQTGIRVWNNDAYNKAAPTPSEWNQYVSDITITNNVIDKVWTTYENDPAIKLNGEGIYLLDAVQGGLIRGNKVVNFGHGGISLETGTASATSSTHGVHNVIVELNDVSAGESGYMHAFGVIGLPGKTTNNIIRRNYFHDFTSVSHAGGSNNQIYSNLFVGVPLTTQTTQKQQPYALDIAPWPVNEKGSTVNKIPLEARDLYIVNNTFLNTDQFSIQVTDYNAAPSNVTNNVIANNIFGQYGYNGDVDAEVALDVTPKVTGTLHVNNNAFWDSSTVVARFKDPANAAHYTVAELNTCPNTTPDTCNANTEGDPLFVDFANRDFRLSANSPIKASGTNAYASALGSGFIDYYGDPWDPTNPSIGAIQYGAAPSLLSTGLTPTYNSSSVLYEGSPSKLTDGSTTDYVGVGGINESAYAQIDLGALYNVSKVKMWHFFTDGRTYRDVIVQLSQTADFSSYVTTVFNNDKDNSAGQGYGVNAVYAESGSGKTVNFQPVLARYARFWIGGNSVDPYNQFVELQVYGTTP